MFPRDEVLDPGLFRRRRALARRFAAALVQGKETTGD